MNITALLSSMSPSVETEGGLEDPQEVWTHTGVVRA